MKHKNEHFSSQTARPFETLFSTLRVHLFTFSLSYDYIDGFRTALTLSANYKGESIIDDRRAASVESRDSLDSLLIVSQIDRAQKNSENIIRTRPKNNI